MSFLMLDGCRIFRLGPACLLALRVTEASRPACCDGPGDCASGMCSPGAATRLLMKSTNPTIRGNHDHWPTDRVAEGLKGQDGFAFQETTAEQRA